MLCISMKAGEYFTVGGNTVIQYDHLYGNRVHLMIHAPREVPIVRGTVLERSGGQRPACILSTSTQYVNQLPWNRAKKEALADIRGALDRMGDSPEVRTLKEKLDFIFPSSQEDGEAAENAAI